MYSDVLYIHVTNISNFYQNINSNENICFIFLKSTNDNLRLLYEMWKNLYLNFNREYSYEITLFGYIIRLIILLFIICNILQRI